MRYLLDADILVYWLKGDSDIEANALMAGLDTLALSSISKAELYYGAYYSNYVQKNLEALTTLIQKLTVIPFDDLVANRFGVLKADLRRRGNLVLGADLMIAATALTQNLILVTNNTKHFERITDLTVVNWRVATT